MDLELDWITPTMLLINILYIYGSKILFHHKDLVPAHVFKKILVNEVYLCVKHNHKHNVNWVNGSFKKCLSVLISQNMYFRYKGKTLSYNTIVCLHFNSVKNKK